MAYGASDPRSTLASNTPTGAANPAQYCELDQTKPTEYTEAGSPTWYVRGQNFVLVTTRLKAGDALQVNEQHEYVVLLTQPNPKVRITAGSETEQLLEQALVVVPAGTSSVEAEADTLVIRLFDSRSPQIKKALNADAYAQPDPNVTLLEPWPATTRGNTLQVHYPERVEKEEGRFGRIYRTSSFMVNFLDEQVGPRDTEKLSPHHHDDFEQCSLAVEGGFVHHIRTPWTPKQSEWRPDEHQYVGSPSVTIIPPPTVHTSAGKSLGSNRLIDIFSPPREDFSGKPGWVLNAADYPAPEGVE